jgi:GNAT superfamily N-acetyltransferase
MWGYRSPGPPCRPDSTGKPLRRSARPHGGRDGAPAERPGILRTIQANPHFRESILSLEEPLDDFQRMTFYVYRSNGNIIGVATLYVESPDAGKIRWVYVLPGHQRQGIGTALLIDIERQARKLGPSRLWLVTAEKATWAISLYQKLGYALRERIERPWGFNVRMEKEL